MQALLLERVMLKLTPLAPAPFRNFAKICPTNANHLSFSRDFWEFTEKLLLYPSS